MLEGGLTSRDDDALGDARDISIKELEPPKEDVIIPAGKAHPLSIHHLTLHLPADPPRCRTCRITKATQKYSRRRAQPGVTCTGKDAEERPFGACLHLDYAMMKRGSVAAKSAK